MSKPSWTGTYESLPVGASESSTRLVDGATIDAFANAIQSFNPIHMDSDWARENTPYPDRIAHGVMTTALMSPAITSFCERWQVRTALGIHLVEVRPPGRRWRHDYDDTYAG